MLIYMFISGLRGPHTQALGQDLNRVIYCAMIDYGNCSAYAIGVLGPLTGGPQCRI